MRKQSEYVNKIDYFKDHLTHYSYYRYMSKQNPTEYLPLYKMVKSWLYYLPKRERRILFLHYCLHNTPEETAAKVNMSRTAIYYYENCTFARLTNLDQNPHKSTYN